MIDITHKDVLKLSLYTVVLKTKCLFSFGCSLKWNTNQGLTYCLRINGLHLIFCSDIFYGLKLDLKVITSSNERLSILCTHRPSL